MIEAILVGIFAIVALAALGGWAYTLVSLNRSILPNAQAIQALTKVNDIMDERIRAVLANFEKRSNKSPDPTKPVDQLEEIRARAAAMGLAVSADGTVTENSKTYKPAPEPKLPPELEALPIEE